MSTSPVRAKRLSSIDALRGFDMLGITGGREIVDALAAWSGWWIFDATAQQLRHAPWHGFRAWDLVFPLFLFLAGVSFTFSRRSRRARGQSEHALRRHVVRRGLVLVALGVLYNIGPTLRVEDLRYASVLGRIGLAWMLAALIALRFGLRGQATWIAALLLGYWALLTWVPVPGQAQHSFAAGRTLTDWVDRLALPGRLHRGDGDPEGLLATLPAIATALGGILTGALLVAPLSRRRRCLVLAAAGLLCLAGGALWGRVFPINKNLWSSSFVLWTGGWCLLLVLAFHLALDGPGPSARRLAFPLVVLGSNALAAYLAWHFVDFTALPRWLFGQARGPSSAFALALLAWGLLWGVLYVLHRRRWMLRL